MCRALISSNNIMRCWRKCWKEDVINVLYQHLNIFSILHLCTIHAPSCN